jgi:hypothetical protein
MTNETNPDEKNAQRATQGLDPGRVDDRCQVVEVRLPNGQTVPVSLQAVVPLTEEGQAALGEIVRAAAERMEREHPHAGVIQELMLVSLRSRALLRVAGHADVAARLGAAVRSAIAVIRDQSEVEGCLRAELAETRESRFRWAEEAARLEAEIAQVAELLAVPTHLLHGPTPPTVVDLARWARAGRDSFDRRLADLQAEFAKHVEVHDRQLAKAITELAEAKQRVETAIDLIDEYDGPYASFEDHPKWQAVRDTLRGGASSGWSCRCGTDETDMVHTPERCYSASEPVTRPVSTPDQNGGTA